MASALALAASSIIAALPFMGCGRDPIELVVEEALVLPENEMRIALLGDQGSGLAEQAAVGAALSDYHATTHLDAVFLLGDNFYESGVSGVDDPQFTTKYLDMYPASALGMPFYVVLGNHDWLGNPWAQYAYDSVDPTGRWDAGSLGRILPVSLADGFRIDFILVDSTFLLEDARGPDLVDQVREYLLGSDADLRILISHHPLYSSGDHGDIAGMIAFFLGEFESGRIDLIFSGHDHDMEVQSRELDGDAVPERFVVAGSGCRLRAITAGPYSDFAQSTLGFCALRISSAAMSLEFVDSSGAVVYSASW